MKRSKHADALTQGQFPSGGHYADYVQFVREAMWKDYGSKQKQSVSELPRKDKKDELPKDAKLIVKSRRSTTIILLMLQPLELTRQEQ